ncbi:MAG: DUF1080 domain-containing protein [Nitrospiraceae bacterium]|nr:DUF1080 domain-containing protein [Nitrospiraceae bacterium]
MKTTAIILGIALTLGAVVLPASAATKFEKYQYHMRENRLMRGTKTASLAAIETSGLAKPGAGLAHVATILARVSEVGANSVCFPLQGIDADGAEVSDEAKDAIKLVVKQATWRRVGLICRVTVPLKLGKRARLALVRTAADALKRQVELICWIDAEDPADLVAEFKKIAPRVIVAATEGGDVQVVNEIPAPSDKGPKLVLGKIPPLERRNIVSFLLPDAPQSYDAFDEAYTHPSERLPWTPDNSLLTEEERADGWTCLFDGKSLDGWWVKGTNPKGFAVKDGTIEWAGHGGEMLMTHDRYDNFILRIEWKIVKDGNSGIFLRAPRANRASKIGMEFQLQGDYGLEPEKHITGAIYDVAAPLVNAGKPAGEWNELEVTLDGTKMKAVLNGQVVQDLDLNDNDELRPRLRRGFIALQDHGRYVAFRNIRIKKL